MHIVPNKLTFSLRYDETVKIVSGLENKPTNGRSNCCNYYYSSDFYEDTFLSNKFFPNTCLYALVVLVRQPKLAMCVSVWRFIPRFLEWDVRFHKICWQLGPLKRPTLQKQIRVHASPRQYRGCTPIFQPQEFHRPCWVCTRKVVSRAGSHFMQIMLPKAKQQVCTHGVPHFRSVRAYR